MKPQLFVKNPNAVAKPSPKIINHDDREFLITYLRRKGAKIARTSDNETVAREFAKRDRVPMPPPGHERMAFLIRVLAETRAETEKRVASRDVMVFRPLKISRERLAVEARVQELRPHEWRDPVTRARELWPDTRDQGLFSTWKLHA